MSGKSWRSRKLAVLAAFVLLTFGTMWAFAWARVPDAAWATFGTVTMALMGPVMAYVGVQGWIDGRGERSAPTLPNRAETWRGNAETAVGTRASDGA